MDAGGILAFTGVAAVLTITPGIDMALVARSALTTGARATSATTLGIVAGLGVWGVVSALGVSALVAASATAFTVLKVAGAAYLVFLGSQTVWRAVRGEEGAFAPAAASHGETSRAPAFRQGLLSNVLNPKIAVFYTTLLPQFVFPGDPVLVKTLLLAGIHAAMSLAWLTVYGRIVARAGDLVRRPGVRRGLEAVTGSALVGLGVALALEPAANRPRSAP